MKASMQWLLAWLAVLAVLGCLPNSRASRTWRNDMMHMPHTTGMNWLTLGGDMQRRNLLMHNDFSSFARSLQVRWST